MCGVRMMFSIAVSGEFFRGSSVKTSSAAPATRPCFRRLRQRRFIHQFAARAIHQPAPRASFFLTESALIMPAVCGVRPTCRVR